MSRKKILITVATVMAGLIGGAVAIQQLVSGNPASGMIIAAGSLGLTLSILVGLFNKSDAFNPDVLLESLFK